MNKSLTPFIILFSFVIMITLIIINSGNPKKQETADEKKALTPTMTLSPFTDSKSKAKSKLKVKSKGPKSLINFDEDEAEHYINEARQHFARGNRETGEDYLRMVLVFKPDHVAALYMYGGVCMANWRYTDAEYIFKKLITLKPEKLAYYSSLVKVYEKQRKYNEAIQLLKKMEIAFPGNPLILMNLSRILSASGKTDESLKYFKRVYSKIGKNCIELTYDELFDNLRNTVAFEAFIRETEKTASNDPLNNNQPFQKK